MANNGSYSNERINVDVEFASDPASGGFFNSDFKKHDDLKQMLDANKDGLKLEAMKRIIGMIAKGRDASELFPAVVKNVVSKNIEVKKLVYVYLVRYAEEEQDLALLSISTFQRALKDPNQLIRASALRVLSSIRVPVIVPIVMLAIKDSASDMSPYVRKTAAHAIPKLHSLDPTQKEELIVVIEKLLSDKTTLVVGSAVMAFEEVCPERIELIHKNYRKLCNLLVDVDEWGQVIIINMLSRYARTQFVDPNKFDTGVEDENKPFYEDENEKDDNKTTFSIDPDHRLLLRNCKPLLQSRNASVVMAVSQLYHHLAPRAEIAIIAKALVRLLRSHREVQSVVLNCIASVSTERKGMFEPFLKSFFVRTSDPTHIKLLKLEILTNLATETSISVILREFQTYISSPDKEFVAAAIQAIGRCASNIKEVTDSCLTGLVSLLSNQDEAVVAESVVVIKKLLQSQPSRHRDIIRSMARLVDTITVPAARASILWLLGEYSELVPTIAPDVLRKMAKSFINEEDIVKLQVLNLAVKLYLTNPTQTKLLCQYVFTLGRYDQNYDIRDRSRFLRQFIFPANSTEDREKYQMGSLSHYLNTRCWKYHDLPEFPEVAPDQSARNVSPPTPPPQSQYEHEPISSSRPSTKKHSNKKTKSFYSESESSPADESSEADSSKEESSTEDGSTDDEASDMDTESDSGTPAKAKTKKKEPVKKIVAWDSDSDEEESSDDSSSSDSSSDDSSDEEDEEDDDDDDEDTDQVVNINARSKVKTNHSVQKSTSSQPAKPQSNLDLLLDLGDVVPNTPIMTPSLGGFLSPMSVPMTDLPKPSYIQLASASYIPMTRIEVLNKVISGGLAVDARFTRQPHLYSPKMVSVELTFTNFGTEPLTDIKMSSTGLPSPIKVHDFAPISSLDGNGAKAIGTIGVDWSDSTQPVNFEVSWASGGSAKISFSPPIGELVRAVTMPINTFLDEQGKLKGMNEHSTSLVIPDSIKNIPQRIFNITNVSLLTAVEPHIYRFCGQTLSSSCLVLITICLGTEGQKSNVTVHCEKLTIGSMLLNEIQSALKN